MAGSPLRIPLLKADVIVDGVRTGACRMIDLRSPGEFAEDHVPGAVNVPLFDDFERELVGTLYARRSPEAAFEEGRRRTRDKIHELVARVGEVAGWEPPDTDLAERVDRLTAEGMAGLQGGLELESADRLPEGAVVFGCWRGGLRSQSVIALCRGLGLERAVGLEGGYKAYRRWVRERVEGWQAPRTFVLRGWTGVGKTLVLRRIEALRPGWTLDLEGLAGHRSSILGMVGLAPCSQRTFDSRLVERLAGGFPGPCVVEGESRKVGDVILPPTVWEALQGGTGIELTAPIERRVRVLVDDYLADEGNREPLARQLPFIEERLGKRKWAGELVRLLEEHREDELVEILLERYYDPLYCHSESRHAYAVSIDSSDTDEAAERVVDWVEATPSSPE